MATVHLLPGGPSAPVTAPRRSPAAAPRRHLVAVPAVAPRPAPPLRLTRRGRLVVRFGVGLIVGVVVMVAVLLLVRPALAGPQVHGVAVRYHLVMPGETLLQIAAEEVPGVDARDTAARIIQLNALRGSALDAGQRLALPVRG